MSKQTAFWGLFTILVFLLSVLLLSFENKETRTVKVTNVLQGAEGTTWYLANGDSLSFSYARPGEMTLVNYYYGSLFNDLRRYEEHPAMRYSGVFR